MATVMSARRSVVPKLNGPHYTVAEAARVIGIEPRSAWRYAKDGRLKSIKVSGRFFIPVGIPEKFEAPPHGNPQLGQLVKERMAIAAAVIAKRKGCKGGKGK